MSGYIVRNKNGTEKSLATITGAPGAPVVEAASVAQALDMIALSRRTHAGPPVRCPGCRGGCDCLPEG